jgi:hypothetical protein
VGWWLDALTGRKASPIHNRQSLLGSGLGGSLEGPPSTVAGRDVNLDPSSIPSLGDGVMLGTAWIDRPVDTRGCTPLPRPFRAAWKCSHARAICDR